jgi:hypothetical protein
MRAVALEERTMPWQACESETHPTGFPFAIVAGDAVVAWCKREEDAQAIVEGREAAAEIADLADPSLDGIDETKRRRIRVLVTRIGEKLPAWRALRPDAHPDGFPWAITDGADRAAYVATSQMGGFVVELGASVPELAAITRAAIARADEPWTKQDIAVAKTLALRLRRRLAEIGG